MTNSSGGLLQRAKSWGSRIALLAAVTVGFATSVSAQQVYNDGIMPKYFAAAKGRTVAFVPIALTFDITTEYLSKLRAQADRLGYKLVVRDPNWSVDRAVQAVEQLIQEKPDIIIAHPLDGMAFNRLVKRANDAGIYWIWANLKGPANGDAYVGANHYEAARIEVQQAANFCKSPRSTKIALIQSPPTNYVALAGTQGVRDELTLHPQLQLVALQTADADANKAKAISATILKQHPDLCAFIGQWDGADIGIMPAVKEAGMVGKVGVITTGGGSQSGGCDEVAQGAYTAYVDYDIESQARDLNAAIMQILQNRPKPGSEPFAVYSENTVLTKDNLKDFHCWAVK
jgi:ribose transport system substrate-binding protein